MPQVFGAEETGLINQASLWVEAAMDADEFIRRTNAHEAALERAGFSNDPSDRPVYLDKTKFNDRGQIWTKHLGSDSRYHTHLIAHVANPDANPNEEETAIGGAIPRWRIAIHKTPVNPENPRTPSIMEKPVLTNNPVPLLGKMTGGR